MDPWWGWGVSDLRGMTDRRDVDLDLVRTVMFHHALQMFLCYLEELSECSSLNVANFFFWNNFLRTFCSTLLQVQM